MRYFVNKNHIMSTNNNTSKIIIAILSLLLLGSIGYIFKLKSDLERSETTTINIEQERDDLINELEKIKADYNSLISENSELSEELLQEKQKVEELLQKVKSGQLDKNAISKYKSELSSLQAKYDKLLQENEALKIANESLTQQVDSVTTIVVEQQEYNQVLIGQNEELAKTVEKGSKLSVLNLKTSAYKLKSSGKEIETDKARRADMLKIEFTIAENKIAKSGDKQYYVQVIDANNNVLGEKKSVFFGDKELTYSFITSVKYNNSTINVSENLKGDNFDKGNYFVNVFDKDELVSKTSFTLK